MGFWEEFRRGRDDIRGGWQEERPHQSEAHDIAELEAALRERDDDLEEALRVMAELKEIRRAVARTDGAADSWRRADGKGVDVAGC